MIRRLLGAAAACLMLSPAVAAGPVVKAPAGDMEGVNQGTLEVFKGIPYAEPPVGERRWKAPVPLSRWSGVKQTTAFGPSCMQPKPRIVSVYTDDVRPMSEDCLSLNIWAPKNAKNAPVFFWIYGGALVGGSTREAFYDGSKLAERGIVVVTINYRLGVFGFLAHPELSAESPLGVSGNYGLLDQIAALKWVRQNIGAFGGNPSDVTIAGESAGGLSVMYLMASPEARGLFSKAIAESAYMISMPELKVAKYGAPSAEQTGLTLAAKLKAPNIAAMRAIDAETLANAAPADGYVPWLTVDGKIVPAQLIDIFSKGEQAHVPILAGFNAGEIRSLRVLAPQPPASAAEYESVVRDRYGKLANEFLQLYPSTNMEESILAATRDALYGWTAERLVRSQAAAGEPSYLYLWDHGYPAADEAHLHAFHASELPYVFGTLDPAQSPKLWPKIPSTQEEKTMSDAMADYWASFVRSGRPQATNEPDWPAYDTNGAYMHFTQAPQPSDHLMPGMYKLTDKTVCIHHANNLSWGWLVGLWSPKLPDNTPQCD